MTTSTLMSLPINIAWRRLAFDDELMVKAPTAAQYPSLAKPWVPFKPSVTIFYAHPDPTYVPEDYDDKTITYLKVVCSLSGYTPLSNSDLGDGKTLPPGHPASKFLREGLLRYYGCYGALLEVWTYPYPLNSDVPLDNYPYIIDFQPKKREVIQYSETGRETLTGSLSSVNVTKNSASGSDNESYDDFPQISQKRKAKFSQLDKNEVADASRERRETTSHTTELAQLYHLLDSYQLGLNHTQFFMQPRPHVLDPKYQTFVDGPRRLEGIQEFFLIVIRPKDVEGLCVRAQLRTGHFAFGTKEHKVYFIDKVLEVADISGPKKWGPNTYTHVYQTELDSQETTLQYGGQDIEDGYVLDKSVNAKAIKAWKPSMAKLKSDVDLKGPGWDLKVLTSSMSGVIEIPSIAVNEDAKGVTLVTSVKTKGETKEYDVGPDMTFFGGRLGLVLTLYLKQKPQPTLQPASKTAEKPKTSIRFFTRTKGVGGCLDSEGKPASWPTETTLQDRWLNMANADLAHQLNPQPTKARPNAFYALRVLQDQIRLAMVDEAATMDTGRHSILKTDFALGGLRDEVGGIDDEDWLATPIMELTEISPADREVLREAGVERRASLLDMEPEAIEGQTGKDSDWARSVYLGAWEIPAELYTEPSRDDEKEDDA